MIWDDKSIAFLRDASAATKVGESLKKRGRILNKGYVYLCKIFKYFEVALVTGSELVALIANGNLLINHVCFRELTEVCLFSLPQKNGMCLSQGRVSYDQVTWNYFYCMESTVIQPQL